LEFHIYQDDLTEVHNYRCLYKDIEFEINNATSEKVPFTLAFIDLDNFKSVNDKHGHIVGSSILKKVSKLFLEFKNEQMKVYRYGGDEFVVLLRKLKEADSKKPVFDLVEKISELSFDIGEEEKYSIQLSIGFAEFPRDGSNFNEIIAIADKMMYEAKKVRKKNRGLKKVG
jgi:diguanylate cyclase (GGDEF)-like protein